MCLAVAACSKDELPGTHGEFASLTLSVASSQNDVKPRAVSADADEQRINNLYIFIFNRTGWSIAATISPAWSASTA